MLKDLAEIVLTTIVEAVADGRWLKRISLGICKAFGISETSRQTRRLIHGLCVVLCMVLMLVVLVAVLAAGLLLAQWFMGHDPAQQFKIYYSKFSME